LDYSTGVRLMLLAEHSSEQDCTGTRRAVRRSVQQKQPHVKDTLWNLHTFNLITTSAPFGTELKQKCNFTLSRITAQTSATGLLKLTVHCSAKVRSFSS
jgi:hypothetical protein